MSYGAAGLTSRAQASKTSSVGRTLPSVERPARTLPQIASDPTIEGQIKYTVRFPASGAVPERKAVLATPSARFSEVPERDTNSHDPASSD